MTIQFTLRPSCCGKPMHGHGVYLTKTLPPRLRHHCSLCGSTIVDFPHRLKCDHWIDEGRQCVYLGIHHPYANSAGWQYNSRYVIMCHIERPLHTDEHVHHIDGDKLNDMPSNLELLLMDMHTRLHASTLALLTSYSHAQGKLFELDVPVQLAA